MGLDPKTMEENVLNAMPSGFNLKKQKKFVWYIPTQGALGFAIVLHALGILSFEAVLDIMKSMIGKYHNGKIVDKEYLKNLAETLSVPEFAKAKRDLICSILLGAME
jgi:hypothetical protein